MRVCGGSKPPPYISCSTTLYIYFNKESKKTPVRLKPYGGFLNACSVFRPAFRFAEQLLPFLGTGAAEPDTGNIQRFIEGVLLAALYYGFHRIQAQVGGHLIYFAFGGYLHIPFLFGLQDLYFDDIVVGHTAKVNLVVFSQQRKALISKEVAGVALSASILVLFFRFLAGIGK